MYFGGIAARDQRCLGEVAFYTCTAAPFGDVEASGSDVVEQVAFVPEDSGVVLRSREFACLRRKFDCREAYWRRTWFAAEEDLQMARDFAAAIGGELGCTRPLTERRTGCVRRI